MARRVYLWSAWLFMASVIFQVFAIGLYLFAGFDLGLHFLGALIVFVMSILVTIAAASAGTGGRAKRMAAALIGLTIIQGILPGFKDSAPLLAALHPVNALLLFWVGSLVVRDARLQATMPASQTHTLEAAPAEAPPS